VNKVITFLLVITTLFISCSQDSKNSGNSGTPTTTSSSTPTPTALCSFERPPYIANIQFKNGSTALDTATLI
jgi:hypothetical protein